MGHVRDLPESRLGIAVEKNFALTYVVPAKKADRVKELQAIAKQAETITLATDPDREGEAIAWHIATLLTPGADKKSRRGHEKPKQFQRITFHEITEKAIKEALSHPGSLNMPLVDAQQARRVLDRLVGYKLSPLLWRKIRRGLSAGRVQSVAVRLIVEREREIERFRPIEYWEVTALLRQVTGVSPTTFEAKLHKIDSKEAVINTKDQVDRVVSELSGVSYKVANIAKREVKRNPYAPFTTSTLQQAAASVYGWSAKRTMQIAQNLYEQGLITYHRTDSTNLAVEAVTAVRDFIGQDFGANYLPESPRLFKTKSKVAQEAHEAIRPTNALLKTEAIHARDREQGRLYELIWKRFVASQMTEARSEQTTVDISAGSNYTFRASGTVVLFDGWQVLFPKTQTKEEKDPTDATEAGGEKDDRSLPPLTLNEDLSLLQLDFGKHFTLPPPRFSEASLIKILEEYGIGRPSTYAPIISTILERQYVEKLDKRLIPTALGSAVTDFLLTHFPSLFDYQFTAKMEDELDEIANGTKKDWIAVIKNFYDPFAKQLNEVSESAERVRIAVLETDEKCPNCGAALVVRVGKFGKFLACSTFPECKFTKPFVRKIDVSCPKCSIGEVVVKTTRSKKTFYGCSRYPECDYASWNKPKVPEAEQVN